MKSVEAIPFTCEAIPPCSRPIFEATRRAVNELDAELILKRAAILAHERLLDIQEMEQKNGGKLFRNGMNEIVQFASIGDKRYVVSNATSAKILDASVQRSTFPHRKNRLR